MSVFDLFRRQPRQASTADTARDRLQILLAHERTGRSGADVLPLLQRDIMEAIERRMKLGEDNVDIRIERSDDLSTIEINIDLPGQKTLEVRARA